MNRKARIFASYLPQFHPIPENDLWWGKGFTEWTNVGKAKPLFKGHYQPRVPADLGYYDLRVPETRQAQADLAAAHGIEGFCYWHYWFGDGKRLLEHPFREVLTSGEPDFPFALAWANESWQGFDYGAQGRNVLIEQKYPGKKDLEDHFYSVLPALHDKRYLKIDGKPIFMVFRPMQVPDVGAFIEFWQDLSIKNGLNGMFFIAHTYETNRFNELLQAGYDAVNVVRLGDCLKNNNAFFTRLKRKLLYGPNVLHYKDAISNLTGQEERLENCYPTLIPNWDHTPRTGRKGSLLHQSTPELFARHLQRVLDSIEEKQDDHKVVFLKSWNEWAEGNYIEPDLRFGKAYLEVIRQQILS